MREIEFRGISVDSGEWVYGWVFGDKAKSIIEIDKEYPNKYGVEAYYTSVVIPETVGQYTGLKDKNGKEIYEGDICNCREYECFGKVEWNNEEAGFYFCVVMEGGGFEEERLYDYIDELTVIGNIYDNPELLEASND